MRSCLRRRRKEGVEIPVTPLIDIVFLLLIYFLLTSHFVKIQALKVRLPENTTRASTVKEETLTITISKEGDFWINGKKIPRSELTEAIETEVSRIKARRIFLEADRRARVQLLVTAMDAARKAGIKEIAIKTLRVP